MAVGLLDLPREIRIDIYSYILPRGCRMKRLSILKDDPVGRPLYGYEYAPSDYELQMPRRLTETRRCYTFRLFYSGHKYYVASGDIKAAEIQLSLLRVCKKVHYEVKAVFYRSNHFIIDAKWIKKCWIGKDMDALDRLFSNTTAGYLQSLEIITPVVSKDAPSNLHILLAFLGRRAHDLKYLGLRISGHDLDELMKPQHFGFLSRLQASERIEIWFDGYANLLRKDASRHLDSFEGRGSEAMQGFVAKLGHMFEVVGRFEGMEFLSWPGGKRMSVGSEHWILRMGKRLCVPLGYHVLSGMIGQGP